MPRFAANLSMMYTEVPFLDRFERAARSGFDAVEFLFPYPFPATEIKARLQGNGLALALFNTPAGDWDAGERGIAILPDRVSEFRDGVFRAIDYAKALDCEQLNCLVGIAPVDADPRELNETLVGNLRFAASTLARENIKLLVEPINTLDIPGFFLNGTEQAVQLVSEVRSNNLFVQYDIYHMQIMEGDLARTMQEYLPQIAHIQLADNPGRHEPGTGEINFPFLFRHLDAIGYRGWIGCEYKPRTTTLKGLSWHAAQTFET
jgi:hydroxypyruvate isomerase